MTYEQSTLQRFRLQYQPKLPDVLHKLRQLKVVHDDVVGKLDSEIQSLLPVTGKQPFVSLTADHERAHTPKRIGVLFSGGQAPGGHNVVSGLFDSAHTLHPQSKLYGFLMGPQGLLDNKHILLEREQIASVRNLGGFDLLGSGRTKIKSEKDFQAAADTVDKLQLDGLVIIGGDDSNTNAALLAEHFKSRGIALSVIGIPKTIDGDLKNSYVETSFGFDTASKTYSDTIGNICRDALSARKYYHFIKLMGRSASHITLECALQTHPNYVLIGEEVFAQHWTLAEVVGKIADVVCERAHKGKNYGVILLPEGLIEFIPEVRQLIEELNRSLVNGSPLQQALSTGIASEDATTLLKDHLTEAALQCFKTLPTSISKQLLLDRDPHGNVQVSHIETERLIIELVSQELAKRRSQGKYQGKFSAIAHFLGYEGRSCFPSNFDSQYCYALGYLAALFIQEGMTGYLCSIMNLAAPVHEWQCKGVPLAQMMAMEQRGDKHNPVIAKALVDLEGMPFKVLTDQRSQWRLSDEYRFPGPIQFAGPPLLSEAITMTLALEQNPSLVMPTMDSIP